MQLQFTPLDACWLWAGQRNRRGYGTLGGGTLTHRLMWEWIHGPVPAKRFVLHHGDHPPCGNPGHLWLGTHADHMRDKAVKGRAASGDRNGSRTRPERLRRGQDAGAAKLTDSQVRMIRARYAGGGVTLKPLAAEYGVTFGLVGHIIHRRIWRHLP